MYPVESAGDAAWGRSTEYTKASIEHYSKNGWNIRIQRLQMLPETKAEWNIQQLFFAVGSQKGLIYGVLQIMSLDTSGFL